MSLRQRVNQLDLVQKSRMFKIIATAALLIAGAVVVGYALLNNDAAGGGDIAQRISELPQTLPAVGGGEVENPQLAPLRQLQALYTNANPGTLLAVGAAVGALMLVLVVWLGLGLVYPAALLLVLLLGLLVSGTRFELAGSIAMGMLILSMSFMVLMRAMSLALSFAHPVPAIARNVLAEAIRMKISLVFIIMLFFALAAMPMLMNPDTPLRYRVQSFLQYASSSTFAFIALLVVFFGAATVTYEQREKVIWQTMTKPVAAWQYVLGKWLGVVTLAAVLLTVSANGVFLFTEYLRNQPANGEIAPYQPADGSDITEDRLVLETQVLASRVSVLPAVPFSINDEGFRQALENQIARERQTNPAYNPDPAERRALLEKIYKDEFTSYFSVDPTTERYESFAFGGLGRAKALNLPLTLRYKINAEGNRPDITYILSFVFENGGPVPPRRTGLGFSHQMTISPDYIDNNGVLRVQIFNGQLIFASDGNFDLQVNRNTFTIPPDGLEISYSVGGYRANFVRVFFVLWVKLALLAMLAVWASTFSSFPVACLISAGVFFMAESAGFVQGALPGWGKTNVEGDPSLYRTIIYHFADGISSVFKIYNDLRPTGRLTEGMLLSWGSVSRGVMALGAACSLFYLSAVVIFRKRQLAIYSGH